MRVWIAGSGIGGAGTVLPADDATISVYDHGITVGDGVFETVKAVGGEPFALTRHLRRLARSARSLGLPDPHTDLVAHGVRKALDANPDVHEARVRITMTGGPGPLGSNRSGAEPTYIVAIAPLARALPSVDVTVVPWTRNENGALAGVKSTSYAENVLALSHAIEHGGSEAIFANTAGNLCEGTGSNIFVVVEGRLVTPPLSAGPLAGITRELVLEWAGGEEANVPMSDLPRISEAFLASTARDVQPIDAIELGAWAEGAGRAVRMATPGPVTRKAMDVFTERSAADMDP